MKKLAFSLFILAFIQGIVFSQPDNTCLPDGITFTNQTQINNFQISYPGCTEIEGPVVISGENITNLNGLSVLTSMGALEITGCNSLGNLSGLENLTNIAGYCEINENLTLMSLTGLNSLADIGGDFYIGYNNFLVSPAGLENLSSIGGSLRIISNASLFNLMGLESLGAVGSLEIKWNYSLLSLNGLNNLTSIGGDLRIVQNTSLSSCGAQWLCDYLSDPGGKIEIWGNVAGCSSVIELANTCGGSMPCLPYGNYIFVNQEDIDYFQTAFPSCTELAGDRVSFGGGDISNLDGLTSIINIQGSLEIGMNLGAGNYNGNPYLTDLTGLSNLDSIGGALVILDNESLAILDGLDNIYEGSIGFIQIVSNETLSACAVESICNFLDEGGFSDIHDNAAGCNSEEEVEAECLVGIGPPAAGSRQPAIMIYPNPSSSRITIELPCTPAGSNTFLTVYNLNGQQLLQRQITESITTVDAGALPQGIYILKVTDDQTVQVAKIMIKQ